MATKKTVRTSQRRWVYLFFSTAITLALLVWALHDVSPTVVWHAMQGAKLHWLGLGLVTFLASYSVRARRWGTLLETHCDPGSFGMRQSAVFIGFAANNVLPARGGEVIRAAVLHRFEGVPFGSAVGSILTERLLDIVVVFLFLLAPLLPGTASASAVGTLPLGWIGAALIVICCAFLVVANLPNEIARLVGSVSRVIGLGRFRVRIVSGVSELLGGLDALRHPGCCATALVETFCIWGLTAMTYWSCLLAFGINSPGLTGALFLQSVTALAIALPSSPGYVGPFEAAIRFGLGVYAIPVNIIVAYVLTLRVLMYVSVTVIGFAFAAQLGLSTDMISTSTTSADDVTKPTQNR